MAKNITKKEILEREKRNKIINRIIEIILLIIIILLLLHNCELSKKNGKTPNGNVNIIDITCDNKKCDQKEKLPVDCLVNSSNSKCIVPNFVGKTKEDVLEWLSTISNIIDIEYKTVSSSEKDGTVLEQSISGITIKQLLEGKNKLIITIANSGSIVDCLADENNSKCVVPNFVGKTKKDVKNWLNTITNYVKVKYVYKNSSARAGTILDQSIKSGKKVKDVITNNEVLIITIATNSTPKPSNNSNKNNNNNNNNDDEGTADDGEEEEITGEFYVNDSNVRWSDETELKIFTDSLYNIEGKIAPESSNTYKFVVNNKTAYNLKYQISFVETNLDNINMKYKLKKNNTYIVDHYVSYNELNITDALLNSASKDTYYLEWKWVSSDNDTQIGLKARNTDVNYKLKIDVEAESIDE